jgi:hypothetical protein
MSREAALTKDRYAVGLDDGRKELFQSAKSGVFVSYFSSTINVPLSVLDAGLGNRQRDALGREHIRSWPMSVTFVGHHKRVTQSAAHADAFYDETLRTGLVWTLRDQDGYPAPQSDGDRRVQPFWSSQSRVQKIISTLAAYAGMEPDQIELPIWRERWLPGLERDGLLVGLNWSGERATGYDVDPADVIRALDARTTD